MSGGQWITDRKYSGRFLTVSVLSSQYQSFRRVKTEKRVM